MNQYEKYKPIYDEWIKNYPRILEDLDGEIWRVVPEYEDYHCSNFGRVKSFKNGQEKILKPALVKGYLCVKLYKGGKQKVFLVARLVAICFIPNHENKPEVNHIRGRFNNFVDCLEWATGSENMEHAVATGLQASGEDIYNAKLTSAQAEYVRVNPDNLTGRELAEKFGVNKSVISAIQLGKTYKNVGGKIRKAKNSRIHDEIRNEIRNRYALGSMTQEALAKEYGVCLATICKIIHEEKR